MADESYKKLEQFRLAVLGKSNPNKEKRKKKKLNIVLIHSWQRSK